MPCAVNPQDQIYYIHPPAHYDLGGITFPHPVMINCLKSHTVRSNNIGFTDHSEKNLVC